MPTLRETLPKEFFPEHAGTQAHKLDYLEVVAEHFGQGMEPWPGPQKHVYCWWELEQGYAVGWNENPNRGWSFPVIRIKLKTA